jgi:predicted aldo/keto reductase-like oxidoreductase
MRYKTFGKTGKEVSVLGFGGMRFTENDDEAIAVVRRAVELGINYIDTAPGYCQDRSEGLIGQALEGIRDKAYLSTKSHIGRDATADEMRKRLETSLERFRTERIEFYQMWNIASWEQFEKVTAPGGPYEGAVKAKEEGLIHHICFTTHAPGDVIRRVIETGLFEGVTMGYNVINAPFRREGIDAAREAGIGAVSMNSLAGGLVPQGREFFSDAAGEGESLIATALRHNFATPGLTVALSGMGRIAEVEENVAAAEADVEPDEETVRKIRAQFEALGEKFCTSCGYCMPCPSGVPIFFYVRTLDRERVAGEEAAEKYFRGLVPFIRKSEEWKPAAECTECGECVEKCTQGINVMEKIKEAAKYDRLLNE